MSLCAAVLVGLVALWLLASAVGAAFVLRPWTWPVRERAMPAGQVGQSVQFTAADGTALDGWYFDAPAARGAVVLAHGAFENRLGVLDCLPPLAAAGLAVLSFDFRARGRSGGRRSTIGWRETDDLLAAVARARELCSGRPVGIMGFSQGAAAALMAAARDGAIAGVVADSAYDRLDRTLDRHLRTIFPVATALLGAPSRWLIVRGLGVDPATVSPLAAAATLSGRPLLLIHGTGDFMCELAGSQRLQAAAGPSCELWTVPRARHTKARQRCPADYWQRVGAFWERVLRPAG